MRPDASVSGTRWTRCTPDSNFSLANAPRPRISAMISLKPPARAFAGRHHLGLPALLGGIALVHAEQVAGEQRGLVAAGAGADFEDDVALVHRVLRQQREADLRARARRACPRAPAFSALAIARISASLAWILDQRLDTGQFGGDGAIGLDLVDDRLELGEFARQGDEFVGAQAGRDELRLHRGMAGEQRIELAFWQRDHDDSSSSVHQTGRPSASAKARRACRAATRRSSGLRDRARTTSFSRLADVEFEDHRLHRADRRRRPPRTSDSRARSGPARRAAARRARRTASPACRGRGPRRRSA